MGDLCINISIKIEGDIKSDFKKCNVPIKDRIGYLFGYRRRINYNSMGEKVGGY
ncbi:hypothetical protein ES705_20029 [subsurface metagenome]